MPHPPYTGADIRDLRLAGLVQVTAWSPTPERENHRAACTVGVEFRVRGVVTNLRFMVINTLCEAFAHGEYTTRFIDETPELFSCGPRKPRFAPRHPKYLGATCQLQRSRDQRGRARTSQLAAAAAAGRARSRPRTAPSRVDELGDDGLCSLDAGEAARAAQRHQPCANCAPSIAGDRAMRTSTGRRSAQLLRELMPTSCSRECMGRGHVRRGDSFRARIPGSGSRVARAAAEPAACRCCCGSQCGGLCELSRPSRCASSWRAQPAGIDVFRIFDSLKTGRDMPRGDRLR